MVWLTSTERDPVNLSIVDDLPITEANNLKIEVGKGQILAGRFNDLAINRTNAGVEISLPSDAKKVWLAAFVFVQVLTIRSMRLLIPIMLREL